MWFLTVFGLMWRSAAIWPLSLPFAISFSTWISRSESSERIVSASRGDVCVARTRWSTFDAIARRDERLARSRRRGCRPSARRSPRPSAGSRRRRRGSRRSRRRPGPRSSARARASSGAIIVICRVASTPPIPGMFRSITTTSGAVSRISVERLGAGLGLADRRRRPAPRAASAAPCGRGRGRRPGALAARGAVSASVPCSAVPPWRRGCPSGASRTSCPPCRGSLVESVIVTDRRPQACAWRASGTRGR